MYASLDKDLLGRVSRAPTSAPVDNQDNTCLSKQICSKAYKRNMNIKGHKTSESDTMFQTNAVVICS